MLVRALLGRVPAATVGLLLVFDGPLLLVSAERRFRGPLLERSTALLRELLLAHRS